MSQHLPRHRLVAAALATAALTATGLAAAQPAAAVSTTVVVNEVYGGGGNSGALFNRDFIELYNRSAEPVDLSGWQVQYAAAASATWAGATVLAGLIQPQAHLLIGESPGANAALPPIAADIDGNIAISGSQGRVRLVDPSGTVIDLVGWGGAATFEGTAPAPATSNAQSVARGATHDDTDQNSIDFVLGAPTPQGAADPDPDPDPDPEPVPVTISQIQGTGASSPYAGTTVTTTGVVTASYPTGGLSGYVIQTPGTGGAIDPATHAASDAIFVFAPDAVSEVSLGDTVTVSGKVSEFNGLTELTVAPGAATRIAPEAAPVPAALTWPATELEREALESMLLAPQGPYTVTNTFTTNQFGEVGLAAGTEPLRQPTDAARPGTPEAAAIAADNAARGVILDDASTTNFLNAANSALTPPYVSLTEPIIVGASATFTAPVVVEWRNNAWKLDPVTPLTGDGTGQDGVAFENTRTAAPAAVGGDVSVASFNVLNYFTTLGSASATCTAFVDRTGDGLTVRDGCTQRGAWDAGDLERQQVKIVDAINTLDADVVGLLEIENSAALGEATDEATATLVAALNAAAGSAKWAYVPSSTDLPPVALRDVITNAIIYQPAAVTPVGASRALGTQSADDQAFGNAREPIAQVFRPAAGGERLLFVVNHFKSKGSAGPWPGDADAGDGQGASNESRVRQATALRDWVASIQGDVSSVALAGDFNSYGREDPLQVLYDAGYSDVEQALGIQKSSYSFSGLSGSLDHILLSGAALSRATGGDIWNINSGESVALEYSRFNVHGTLFYAPDEYRSSDHDPVIVGLAAGVDERVESQTRLFALPPVHVNRLLPAVLVALVTTADRSAAQGTVQFREGDTVVGAAPVKGGVATLTLPRTLPRGTHTYTATFVPADTEALRGSMSPPVRVRVIG